MTYQRLAYDDQDTTLQMHLDCSACASTMHLPASGTATALLAPQHAHEHHKPEITVSEATALLAARLYLDLD